MNKIKKILSENIVNFVLFALVWSAFQVMHINQEAETLKAIQTMERIKLKWSLTKD
ncbi:hypothetical protein [Parashewanella tropica]|uniref:hypothetical protein n=1 Tax=Parashewanella tropica TaxID=2547970 RepID=UPI001478A7E1|nr:hypothetical protein [Parashewanella tropica]